MEQYAPTVAMIETGAFGGTRSDHRGVPFAERSFAKVRHGHCRDTPPSRSVHPPCKRAIPPPQPSLSLEESSHTSPSKRRSPVNPLR
jgi:hypothetical protein